MDHIHLERLTQLLNDHSAALVLYAQQWCDVPEDVVQEAFICLIRERPAPSNVVGWLYRVVRNRAISRARSQTRRARHEMSAGSAQPAWFDPKNDEVLDFATAVAALQSLPQHEREVIVLRIWSGLSFEEIAALIGKSTSTAHRWYEAGLAALRNNWCSKCPNSKTIP